MGFIDVLIDFAAGVQIALQFAAFIMSIMVIRAIRDNEINWSSLSWSFLNGFSLALFLMLSRRITGSALTLDDLPDIFFTIDRVVLPITITILWLSGFWEFYDQLRKQIIASKAKIQ